MDGSGQPEAPGQQNSPLPPPSLQEQGGLHGLRLGSVAYILGITLLVIVAAGLVAMACWLRRKDRRHLAALEEARRQADAAEAARIEAQAAEAARRLKEMVIPVVILQPDGTCWLAEELKGCRSDADAAQPGESKGGAQLELAGRWDSGDALEPAASSDVLLRPAASSPAVATSSSRGFLAPMFSALSPAAGTSSLPGGAGVEGGDAARLPPV